MGYQPMFFVFLKRTWAGSPCYGESKMRDDENDNALVPPHDLPADALTYWQSPPHPPRPQAHDLPSALERLGPSPFPRSRFPFLGFLATVYDQVASSVKRGSQTSGPSGGS